MINGIVVGRNVGRGSAIYEISPLVERPVFNLLNHANFVGFSGTYGNGAGPGPGFGQPLVGITNQLPARSIRFSIKVII